MPTIAESERSATSLVPKIFAQPQSVRKYSGGVVSTVVTTCHMPLSDPPAPCTVSASSAQKL